jgi:membrane protein YdbS with pleckstrin-like domain
MHDNGGHALAPVLQRMTHEESGAPRPEGQDDRQLDRRVLVMWWTIGALCAGGVIVASVVLVGFFDVDAAGAVAVSLVGVAAAAIVPPLRYRRWRYEVREHDALISRGALFYVQQLIPFDRIQFVESRQGPLDRVFGISAVILYTAAGKAAHVPGLSAAQAEGLRDELSRVAGTAGV